MFSEQSLALLPAPSREKLEAIIIERNAARAAYLSASDHEQHARQELGRIEGMARYQLSQPAGVAVDAHPAAAVAEARRALTKAGQAEEAERERRILEPVENAKRRLQMALDARERAAEKQSSFAFLEGCAEWLSRAAAFGGMTLRHHAPQPPKTRDPAAEITKLRAELASLDEAWIAAENAPAPASELKSRFMAELDAIAAKGAPSIDYTARSGSPVNLSAALRMRHEPVMLPGADAPHFALSGDAGATFYCWLHRDLIAERVSAMIDAASQASALTDDQRDAEFSRISARRLEVERAEEALTVLLEAEGRIVQRRRNLDPRAILEVQEA